MKKHKDLVRIILFNSYLFCSFFNTQIAIGQDKRPITRIKKLELSSQISSIGKTGGITNDKLGYLYVANFDENVYKASPTGDVVLFSGGLYGSSGNVLDDIGNLYQLNFYGNNIVKIDRNGSKEVFVTDLYGLVGLTLNNSKELIVCNCANNTIVKITDNKEQVILGSGEFFDCPNGVTYDGSGNLYVVNYSNDNVIRITPEGEISTFATIKGGGGNAHIAYFNNSFYITKIKTNGLFKLSINGVVTKINDCFQNNKFKTYNRSA